MSATPPPGTSYPALVFPVKPLETLLFETASVAAGTFRCAADHPLFVDSGPCSTYCFVFPRTHVWIRHVGATPFLGNPNLVALYNQGQSYCRRKLSPEGDRSDWFAVAPEIIEDVLAALGSAAPRGSRRLFAVPCVPTDAGVYVEQRRLMERLSRGASVDPLRTEETIIVMLESLLRRSGNLTASGAPGATTRLHRHLVDAAKFLLVKWVGRRVELTELGDRLDCSVYHLCRIFRQHEGTTIHAYQAQLRLRLALERLAGDAATDITTLALDLGYCSHSHFTAAFRRSFGITPSAFAAELRARGRQGTRAIRLLDAPGRRL